MKGFKCNHCGQEFHRLQSLKSHLGTHGSLQSGHSRSRAGRPKIASQLTKARASAAAEDAFKEIFRGSDIHVGDSTGSGLITLGASTNDGFFIPKQFGTSPRRRLQQGGFAQAWINYTPPDEHMNEEQQGTAAKETAIRQDVGGQEGEAMEEEDPQEAHHDCRRLPRATKSEEGIAAVNVVDLLDGLETEELVILESPKRPCGTFQQDNSVSPSVSKIIFPFPLLESFEFGFDFH